MQDVQLWWGGWEPLVRILLLGSLGYLTLIALLRISGQRTLATMTPFDFIITVTIGSAFGRVLTASDVPMSEMVATFTLLTALQWLVATLRERSSRVDALVSREPVLLYYDGQVDERALRRHRLRTKDLVSAARQEGMGSLDQARAVVLQANGSFAVITAERFGDGSAVAAVERT